MGVSSEHLKAIKGITEANDVSIVPVGNQPARERALFNASEKWGGLRKAAVQILSIAAVLGVTQMDSAHASGLGYDSTIYGQSAGQVLQQGQGIQATVLNVRKVSIEITPEMRSQNALVAYGVPAATASIGAIVGRKVAGKSSSSQQIGAVLGGLLGGLGGSAVVEAINNPGQAKLIPGVEITVMNPKTQGVIAVTQAGETNFSEGEQVLVIGMGGSVRVVHDNSRAPRETLQGNSMPHQLSPHADTAMEIVKTANTLGLRINPVKVALLIEPGPVPNQSYSGKIVGVDQDRGLVYQELGRGDGTVHSLSKLDRAPSVGEYVKVRYSGGVGSVHGKSIARRGHEI